MNSEINYVSPFKKFCISVGNLPTAYLESMSYYESLTYLVNYLANNVIPALNNNGEVVEELQQKFTELKNYVDTYFENLDVQEEINNKLDEMAESGQLTDIIAQYLGLAGMITFDTVADMKLAQNLVNGSKCCTLGYHNINDGGNALYKVRTVTNDDVVDEMFIIELYDDNLVGELIIPEKINPLILGAYGDGTTDDLNILKTGLKYCIDNQKILYIDKTYYISDNLLNSNDYDTSGEQVYVKLNIQGNTPNHNNVYAPDGYGFIKIANNKDVFKDIKIRGSINNVSFSTVSRNTTGSIFNNCVLNSFEFNNNNVSNIGAFLIDTNITSNSLIADNRFLTVYYFAKQNEKDIYITDSVIKNNYINGGSELDDNNCFEFMNYNGSLITNNFIDYYRTIYRPKFLVSDSFAGVTSIGNNYQVFRYLYEFEWNKGFIFNSIGDIFNWNDPTKLQKLEDFESVKYTGHDSNEYDLPPYIMAINETYQINIINAHIQRNMANLVFIKSAIANYEYAQAELSTIGSNKWNSSQVTIASGKIYNGGTYRQNLINIPFIHTLDTLPDSTAGWSDYYIGQKIKVGNKLYKRYFDYDNNQLSWLEYTIF